MNELEKQIEERATDWVFEENGHRWSNNDDSAGDNTESFKAGANFILEKNLDEQFADFLHLLGAVPANEKGKWDIVDKDFNMYTKTTKELKNYWLNNVYGK